VYRIHTQHGLQTLLAHKTLAYCAFIDETTLLRLQELEQSGAVFGVQMDSERTMVIIRTVKQLFEDESVDWSTLGIIAKALWKK
jgi:hypothetical protein